MKRIMNIERQIQAQKQVDKYIKGILSMDEIDKLWVRFLKSPQWFEYFETELTLQAIFNSRSNRGG